jgi:hypothetical protein
MVRRLRQPRNPAGVGELLELGYGISGHVGIVVMVAV